jgi:hypothetical protein
MTRVKCYFTLKAEQGIKMNLHWKQLLAAVLAVLSGLALATPLLISHIVPVAITVQGPKADLSLGPVYASFAVQPTNSDIALPDWCDRNRDGVPSQISYNVVLNVTNNSNETAIVDMLYIDAAHTFMNGSIIYGPKSTIERTVEGVYLDGKWTNITWILSNQSLVGGYWRQGVDIQSIYINGNLTQTNMRIDGQWVNVTGRVTVPGQEPSIANDQVTMVNSFMGETLTFTIHNSFSQLDYNANVQVAVGKDGFNNSWTPNQSRLIMLNGTSIATASQVADLKSSPTYLHLQVSAMLQRSLAPTIPNHIIDTSSLDNILCQIKLTPNNNRYEYNMALTANQIFEPDPFGVEVFIKNRS